MIVDQITRESSENSMTTSEKSTPPIAMHPIATAPEAVSPVATSVVMTPVAAPGTLTPTTTTHTAVLPATRAPEAEAPSVDRSRWVVNISSYQLSGDETSLLAKGGGFAIAPRNIPQEEFIVTTEEACSLISHRGEAAALRAKVTEILQEAKPPKSNLSYKERQAMKKIKENESIIVVPADKGKCAVVMDRQEYIAKMEEKLKDPNTYKEIFEDRTENIKKKIASQLNQIE